MKPSFLSTLILSLVLIGDQTPLPAQGRLGAANAQREEARRRAQPRPQAQRARPASRPAARPAARPAQRPSNAARNPITGSSVKRAQRPSPNPSRTAARPTPPSRTQAKPSPKATPRPAPKAAPRPAPKAAAKSAPKASPKRPAPVANRPTAPRSSAPTAARQPSRPAPKPRVAPKRPASRTAAARRAARPAFVPGKVTYPGRVSRPAARPAPKRVARPANRASRPRTLNQAITANSNVNSNNRVSNVRNNRVTSIGNTRVSNVTNNTYVNNNWGNQWTNNRTSIWNRNRVVNRRPVVVHPNFRRSVNYAYRPRSWGNRPWWSSSTYHNWHHGSWNYGWNRHWSHRHHHHHHHGHYLPGYYDDDGFGIGAGVAWGLAAWTLGSLAYDTGYNSYHNPYSAPPVQTRTTVINYSQPLSVVASEVEPEPEEVALTSEEKSSAAVEKARDAFANGDYLAALKSTDEAISYAPGDSALHEFRALCLFALARYGDAAGVLNPVLASGPGWDWATMAEFYPDGEVYTAQLRKLESYVESKPESADSHFLLGYHYMVAGFIDEAHAMFETVTELQPADTVAAQLRNLAESSTPNAEGELEDEDPESLTGTPEPAPEGAVVEPIDPADLEGSWKAAAANGKAITLALDPAGTFTWNYEGAEDGKVLAGDWSIDDDGRLVLAADDVQMVADVSLDGDKMQFVLAGSPVGDPGLDFGRL